MLHDPDRHEPLCATAWDADRAQEVIAQVVRDTEVRFDPDRYWPLHPLDADAGDTAPAYPLYHGACGVLWALHYLEASGAVTLARHYAQCVPPLVARNAVWLASLDFGANASYLMGETGILLLAQALDPTPATAERLAALIESNLDHPARELMWGAPGTLLAALFLHERTREPRWADAFRATARKLWSQLVWSPECQCHYWTQQMYGRGSSYLDAVHGFVATASPLIRGRHLLEDDEWARWSACIADTVHKTATRDGDGANWRPWLRGSESSDGPLLMQYCHGAPGFVVCLAGLPESSLDDLLLAAGAATWRAGPLRKGSNLCHGTAGNGYALLALYRRTGDPEWLARARAFAMHAIGQASEHERRYGQMRYSLWTGDLGFAIYLWDCIRANAAFPTLEVFFADEVPDSSRACRA